MTCQVIAEEWIHVLQTAKLQQTRRPVIPHTTPIAQAPLAEIEYWNSQFEALKEIVAQLDSDDSVALVIQILELRESIVLEKLKKAIKDVLACGRPNFPSGLTPLM